MAAIVEDGEVLAKCSQDERETLPNDLECHFKWRPDNGNDKTKIPQLESELIAEISEMPSVKIQTYCLLGYVSTLDPDSYDPEKSKKYFEKALEEAGEEEDKRFVAEANLVMIQFETGNRGMEPERNKLLAKWQRWKRDEPRKLAFTYGCQALAMAKFGPNKMEKAILHYEKALELDPDNWIWIFWRAVLLERKRNLFARDEKPSHECLELFEKAKILSNSNVHVLVLYAICLAKMYLLTYNNRRGSKTIKQETGRQSSKDCDTKERCLDPTESKLSASSSYEEKKPFNSSSMFKQDQKGGEFQKGGVRRLRIQNDKRSTHIRGKQRLEGQIRELLHEAKEKALKNELITVLRHCCKCYKLMNWFIDFRACSETLIAISPNDSGSLHQLALYYMRRPNEEYLKAKHYLERSTKASSRGNVYAAVDLIKVRCSLGEEFDVDNEYKKLLVRFKACEADVLYIHENWGISLRRKQPERLDDQIFHFKRAVELYSPEMVQKKPAWLNLRSICTGIEDGKCETDISRTQARKVLGWMYFIPEPKNAYYLQKAEEYFSSIATDELEQDDIEIYGMVLLERKRYQEALVKFEQLDESRNKRKHQAKCYFYLGMQNVNGEDPGTNAEELFLKSVQYGCLDSCEQLLHLLVNKDRDAQYQCCAHINICLASEERFAIEVNQSEVIMKKMEDILGLSVIPELKNQKELVESYLETRHLLSALYTHQIDSALPKPKVLLENAKDVLTRSRSALDHLHYSLQVEFCPGSSNKVYYPLITENQRPKAISPGSQESKIWALENITKRFKNDFEDKDGSKGVADKCKKIVKFIALHQPYTDPERYDWLYDAWDVVNVIKHQKNITEIEYIIPGNGHKVNLVDLAKKLSLYAEEMLSEYCTVF